MISWRDRRRTAQLRRVMMPVMRSVSDQTRLGAETAPATANRPKAKQKKRDVLPCGGAFFLCDVRNRKASMPECAQQRSVAKPKHKMQSASSALTHVAPPKAAE